MMSGGPIEKFREGWAIAIFGGRKAHYWKREGADAARPMCSRKRVYVAALRGAGTYERCKLCSQVFGRKVR